MAKRSYTAKERKAYYMGRAYAAAKAGRRVDCPDSKTKQSFRNGVYSVRGKPVKRKTGGKGKNSCCYVVDSDGVIISTLRC